MLNYYLQGENYLNKEDKKEKIIFSKPLSLAYFKIKDKEVLNERIRQEKFVRILARNLSFFYKINCGLSCGINYNSEFSWVSGFHNGGIPFVILYKEKSEFNNMSLKTTFINLLISHKSLLILIIIQNIHFIFNNMLIKLFN